MPVLVDEIVQHMNAYAYIEAAKENSIKRCNTECDGNWSDTTPAEVLMLIGLLIYFGFVDVKGSANLVYVNFTPSYFSEVIKKFPLSCVCILCDFDILFLKNS